MNYSNYYRLGNLLCVCVAVLLNVSLATGQESEKGSNWPQWRGEDLDNLSGDTELPVEFGKEKNLLWRVEMPGPAGSSPVVWGSQVFVTTVDGDDLFLLCYGSDGKQQWKKQLKGTNKNSRDSANSASPSPFTDGEHVWATTTAGFLQCFTMSGEEIWSIDLQNKYGQFKIQFGMTSTPIHHNGRIYHQLIHGAMRDRSTTSKGIVIALDAKTGDEIWQVERVTDGTFENKHSYASPIICRDLGNECLVTHGGDYVIGHSLEDGKEIWRCGGLNLKGDKYNPFLRFVASPLYVEDKIIVPSAKNGPVFCLKTDLEGDVTNDESAFHWKVSTGTPDVSTPVYTNGLVFLTRENGDLSVLDGKTGEQTFTKRMYFGNHRVTPVAANDKIYLVDRRGKILVLSAEREPEVLATSELGETTTASPAISDGRIFIRTFDALYAFGE